MQMLLIRHAAVDIDRAIPSTAWRLSEDGRLATRRLAQQLSHLEIDQILTSHEPKAIQTGVELASVWRVSAQVFFNLHEHERKDNAFVADQGAWREMVARFLTERERVVFGEESAIQAAKRLESAIQSARRQYPLQKLAFVTHGRILTAFLALHNPALDAVAFWQQLSMPAAVLLNAETFQIKQ